MDDFRLELYERYVSTFKSTRSGSESRPTEVELNAYLDWCADRYGSLFDDVAADAEILELGCGPGDMLEFLRRRGFERVEGIDVAPEQVEIARGRGLNARVADVFECLDSAAGRYRVILAVDFLEHFSKDELMRLAPAIRDALEPGGHLIAQTPNGQGLFPHQVIYGDLTHLTIFTPQSLMQLLRLYDFGEFRFEETRPAPVGWKGKLRAGAWGLLKRVLNLIRKVETGKTQSIWTENMICRATRRNDS